MEIACYIIVDSEARGVMLPIDLIGSLAETLRKDGKERVQLESESVLCEGLYIPAKDSNIKLMIVPEGEVNK